MHVFTSIPPALRGEALGDRQLGKPSFQEIVLQSWRDSSLEPISVNTYREHINNPLLRQLLLQSGVLAYSSTHSKQGQSEKLPNIRSFIDAICDRHPDEFVAITNADIFLMPGLNIKDRCKHWGAHQFAIAYRSDVTTLPKTSSPSWSDASWEGLSCKRHCHGLDFFVVHTDLLRNARPFISDSLTFGLPWWDTLLPLALTLAGGKGMQLDHHYFLHTIHEERWNPDWWVHIGHRATKKLFQDQSRMAASPISDWASKYKLTMRGTTRTKGFIAKLLSPLRGSCSRYHAELIQRLTSIALATELAIDEATLPS